MNALRSSKYVVKFKPQDSVIERRVSKDAPIVDVDNFGELLSEILAFSDTDMASLNRTQKEKMRKLYLTVSISYDTDQYAALYNLAMSKFEKVDLKSVRLATPAAYVLGYKIAQQHLNISCSIYSRDAMIPPNYTIDECERNVIEVRLHRGKYTIIPGNVTQGKDTDVYFIGVSSDDNVISNIPDYLKSSLMKMGIEVVNAYIIVNNKPSSIGAIRLSSHKSRTVIRGYDPADSDDNSCVTYITLFLGVIALIVLAIWLLRRR